MQNKNSFTDKQAQDAAAAYTIQPNPLRLVYKSRQGITRQSLNQLARDMKRSLQELAEILPSSYSTLTKKELFDKATSEHVLMLQELFIYGTEVFGDVSKFNIWLDTSVRHYDDSSLYSLLDTSFGIELVRSELVNIDLGLPL